MTFSEKLKRYFESLKKTCFVCPNGILQLIACTIRWGFRIFNASDYFEKWANNLSKYFSVDAMQHKAHRRSSPRGTLPFE